ncbi:MAG: hypothetical protein B7C24_02165 [Bacteroidetes bacterium 4572_77]|nr:MAG: hypothetical protein B7C24_02165 [Bacteroidetes bacterium 4572_77]
MKKKIVYLSFLMLIFSLTSCYKTTEDAVLEDYDITLTYYNNEFDFSTYNTFYVRDSVIIYSDYLTEEELEKFYTDGNSDKIRAKIVQEFKDLGYTEALSEDDITNASFYVNPIVSLSKQTQVYYYPYWWGYPGYWGWYGGYYKSTDYYYPYWGYYPGWGATSYSYKTGSLIMELTDGDSVRAYRAWLAENGETGDPNTAPIIEINWTAYIEGILSSTASYNEGRAITGVEEAFKQSPYLKK